MYRDDPLDDEAELRDIVGDAAVDRLVEAADDLPDDPLLIALDALRLLQGWVDDERAGAWFTAPQQRLDGLSPVDALVVGASDDVLDAARAWEVAHG